MQWLQSNHDCSYLLYFISTAPTRQCAWETFRDSLLELLTQKVNDWTAPSYHFQEWQKFTQGTPRTLKDPKMQQLLLSSGFSAQQHGSFSKPKSFIGSNRLCIHQCPNLHHIFGGLLSLGLEFCTLHIIWGCSLDVTQKSRRRILCIPRERKCNLPLISSHYKFHEFYSSADVIYSKSLNSCGWHSVCLEETCMDVRKV